MRTIVVSLPSAGRTERTVDPDASRTGTVAGTGHSDHDGGGNPRHGIPDAAGIRGSAPAHRRRHSRRSQRGHRAGPGRAFRVAEPEGSRPRTILATTKKVMVCPSLTKSAGTPRAELTGGHLRFPKSKGSRENIESRIPGHKWWFFCIAACRLLINLASSLETLLFKRRKNFDTASLREAARFVCDLRR
jgi:hypothetical protein